MTQRTVIDYLLTAISRAAAPAADTSADDHGLTDACDACGHRIRSDWRLCPHCGTLRGGPEELVSDG